MASSPKILVIRYTDKAVFLVALGLLGYVAVTSFVVKKTTESDSKLGDIIQLQDEVTRSLNQSKPKPHEAADLVTGLERMWEELPEPRQFRPWLFIRPRPLLYKELRVRVKGDAKTVKLREKLAGQPQLLIAPTCAKLKMNKAMDEITVTGVREAEEAKIVGTDPRGIRHEVPLVVLPAEAPIDVKSPGKLAAEATLEHIVVSWETPDQDKRVKGQEWLVFKKREGEDEFRQIAKISDKPTHVDKDIKSGEIYFYRVRTEVLTDEGPKLSEKSDTIQITAKSMVEFDLTFASDDSAGVEVRRYHNGDWVSANFTVRPGGFIGGLKAHRTTMVDFATGCTVVDIVMGASRIITEKRIQKIYDPIQKRRVAQEVEVRRPFRSNKIVYQDKKNAPREKWQFVQGRSGDTRILRTPDRTAKPDRAAKEKPQDQNEGAAGAEKEKGEEGGGGNLMEKVE